jgi:hypothetical protein
LEREPAQLKFRFRWRALGTDHKLDIEAASYPMACYELGGRMKMLYQFTPPPDLELDLTKPERVEE